MTPTKHVLDIERLLRDLTLEEKASLCSGLDNWHTKPVERLGIPSIMVSDGPHGLRKQNITGEDFLSIHDSNTAVCFPSGPGLAASFDRALVERLGIALGNECQAEDIAVLLGPGANIKRTPLGGRNFEYFSEDPVVSGEIAAAWINGIQSKHIGASLKHYAANNQETRRMAYNAEIDERTLHEIYLANFERAVKKSKPWTVMTSYNKLNGVYGSENRFTLTECLRDAWGFDGFVVTDWGAVNDHIAGILAGCDLEMPSSGLYNDQLVVDAVNSGKLDLAVLDEAVRRILTIIDRYLSHCDEKAVFDKQADHELAREIAGDTIVLLKNENRTLPLNSRTKIAFIGVYAEAPRYQGSGSSHINPTYVLSALEAAKEFDAEITYAKGFDDETDVINDALRSEAIRVADEADAVVVFAGLPSSFESEAYDRAHMRLPDCQNDLIEELVRVNANLTVVLHNGSPVEMPWADDVAAIVEAYLGGETVGGAVCDVLFGKVNPSAKLAETFPTHLEQNPTALTFPGNGDSVPYSEGLYVGYRYYDKKNLEPRFPFGHGLSYSEFFYSNPEIVAFDGEAATVSVTIDVTNESDRFGKEVVQLYVAPLTPTVNRPVQELRDFAKVALNPGETKTLRFDLDARAFAYWETKIHDWYVAGGEYEIRFAASSRDMRAAAIVALPGDEPLPIEITPDTLIGDLLAVPGAKDVLLPVIKGIATTFLPDNYDFGTMDELDPMIWGMMTGMPLHSMRSWMQDDYDPRIMEEVLAVFKAHLASLRKPGK